jgi:hypothetical protein
MTNAERSICVVFVAILAWPALSYDGVPAWLWYIFVIALCLALIGRKGKNNEPQG